jgi:hypothetical protein
MAWCEAQTQVYYCLGLTRNSRLRDLIDAKLARVRELAILCGGVARGFTQFQYRTQKSWTRSRRVSTRRVYIRLASAFPLQKVFVQAHRALSKWAPEEG